jgi:hypothetical protein
MSDFTLLRRLSPAALVPLALAGCFGELAIGEDARLRCRGDDDCPAPTTCLVEAGLCVLPGVEIDTTPPLVVSSSAAPQRIGSGQRAVVTITMDDAVSVAAVAVEGNDDAVVGASVDGAVISVDVDADVVGSGEVVLLLDVTDLAGNDNRVRVDPGLEVDVDAPALAADFIVIGTSRDNVLFPGNAGAARADSVVDVDVIFDEVVDEVVAVVVGGTALDVDSVAIDGTRLAFVIEGDVLAGLDDGALDVAVSVADDVGNVAAVTLGSTLKKDTARPPAPAFARLRRAPFGATTTTVETLAEGSAAEAVLVLALPDGVVVDPATIPSNVAREPVDETGAFSISVGIDIPGLRVVAVDEAGNLSEPSSAARIELVASTIQAASPHELRERPRVAEHLVQRGDLRVDTLLRDDGSVRSVPAVVFRPLTTEQNDAMPQQPLVAEDPIGGGVIALSGGQTYRIIEGQVIRLEVRNIPARFRGAMALDRARGVIVLFGGEGGSGEAQNSLFEFDGERWTEVLAHDAGATDRPRPRMGHAMGFVSGLGVVVGGGCGGEDFNINNSGCDIPIPYDLWAWDGARFTRLCAPEGCGEIPFPIGHGIADDDGVPVAFGGTSNELSAFFNTLDPDPRIHRFEGGRFEASCDDDCSNALPFDGVLDTTVDGVVVLGTCGTDGPCRVSVDGEFATRTLLGGGSVPQNNPDPFQHRVVVDDGRRAILPVGGATFAGVGGRGVFTAIPARMAPRAFGALVERAGDLQVIAGCAAGAADAPPSCTGELTSAESLSAPGVVVDADVGVGGDIGVITVGDDAIVFKNRLGAQNRGSAELRLLSDLSATPTLLPLEDGIPDDVTGVPSGGRIVAGFPTSTAGRALMLRGFTNNDIVASPTTAMVDSSVFLTATGIDGVACSANCGLGVISSIGAATAPIRGGGGLLFGGQTGGVTSGVTLVVDEDGQGTTLDAPGAPTPPQRRFASAIFDPQREVTWLVGGTAADFDFGTFQDNCGGPDQPEDCADLWRFDGSRWERVNAVDLLGVGQPPGRVGAQIGTVGGGFAMSGGLTGRFNQPRTDAWVLDASTTVPATHQLHARFAPYGTDAGAAVGDIVVHWCGSAVDAVGDVVDVRVRVWIGSGWVDTAVRDVGGGCVDGVLDSAALADVADVVQRGVAQEIVAEVVPVLSRAGRDDPTLTTTALTLTAAYAP